MKNDSNIQSGRCQCGEITYSLDKEKVISAHHCHCKDCQRRTGAARVQPSSENSCPGDGRPTHRV